MHGPFHAKIKNKQQSTLQRRFIDPFQLLTFDFHSNHQQDKTPQENIQTYHEQDAGVNTDGESVRYDEFQDSNPSG